MLHKCCTSQPQTSTFSSKDRCAVTQSLALCDILLWKRCHHFLFPDHLLTNILLSLGQACTSVLTDTLFHCTLPASLPAPMVVSSKSWDA